MRSTIELALGNFEVDWGKNLIFNPHNALFQSGDIRVVPCRSIDSSGEEVREPREAYCKPLADVVRRLELLGYSIGRARKEYEALLEFNGTLRISFDDLAASLKSLDVRKVSPDYETDCDFGEFFEREVGPRLGLDVTWSPGGPSRSDWGEVMENLHPWCVLRLLAENQNNLEENVVWCFGEERYVAAGLTAPEQFLIVTEGSSDTNVIRKAIELLRPEVSDFFRFVDMQENYPFTGTGNLYRFCQGLSSIQIINKVLVLYDNDAEGAAKCLETQTLTLPPNMRTIRLPDRAEFEQFQTVGPGGTSNDNINRRAASIECYLDLQWKADWPPVVRWSSYNEKLGCYHGALVNKESYIRRFMDLRRKEPNYDFSGMRAVLDCVIRECCLIVA